MRRTSRALSDRLGSACRLAGELLGEDVVPVWERSPIRVREHWFAKTPNHILYLAHDRTTAERLLVEASRVRWAQSMGIPTPPLVHAGDDLLVYGRVPSDPLRGRACVEALCAITDRLERAPVEPPGPLVEYQGWRPARRTLLRRYLRLMARGVDVREFFRVTRAARALPKDALSHGAFHYAHVFHDEAAGVVRVIDWETLGYHPRFTDLFNIWPSLEHADDRRDLLDHIRGQAADLDALAPLHLQGVLRLRNRLKLIGQDTARVDAFVAEAEERAHAWRS